MSKKVINNTYTFVCFGGGEDRLNPYKTREYEDKTIDKYLEIDNFCLYFFIIYTEDL